MVKQKLRNLETKPITPKWLGGELSSLSQKIVFGSMGVSHICDAPSKHLLR